MLFMSAAFLQGISETVDLNKLPPSDVITKHLSPIVMSQSYDGDGYIAESVGPVTVYQTILGVGGVAGAAAVFYHHQTSGLTRGSFLAPSATPAAPSSSASPAPNPDESPE
jgi:hypothetical protein